MLFICYQLLIIKINSRRYIPITHQSEKVVIFRENHSSLFDLEISLVITNKGLDTNKENKYNPFA